MTARLLGPADYRVMPWANGRGSTTELLRQDDTNGAMLWRLSMARVTEDGPFSMFPNIERNLTVIEGPGFDLVGDQTQLRADPLCPVGFSGDVAISAQNVTADAIDFNLMVARHLGQPEVIVLIAGQTYCLPTHKCAVFALGRSEMLLDDTQSTMEKYELLLGEMIHSIHNAGPDPLLLVRLPDGG